ncbi:MAG: DedA family protein [Gemmatimonadota bacterium]|nr:DedA family protein [Gemmatimonadota bacterium]
MIKWIVGLVTSMGIFGVALLMAIENVVLPLPSELIMPLAGFAASRGRMSLIGVILAGTVGSVLGALPLYYLARTAGEQKMKHGVTKHGQWLMLRPTDLDKPKRWFAKHGSLAVLIGQIIPGVRGLISLPAGYAKMNVFAFLLYNVIGTIVWCGVLAYIGQQLGAHFKDVHKYLEPAGWVVLAGLLVWGGIVVWKRRKGKKRGAKR